jgi:radical SAM protein with 4Fe4S-binding SPASM domain
MKIRKITSHPYKGRVHNFHCSPDEDYFSEGVLVHNCYQNATLDGHIMTLAQFKQILDLLPKTVNQIALGGGEPLEHPEFVGFLQACREHDIVPNFTTNGDHMTKELAAEVVKYCGACAISWHDGEGKFRAVDLLEEAGMRPNVHFLLSKSTLPDAITLLKDPTKILGQSMGKIAAVVFLLYKPQGRATSEDILQPCEMLDEFFELATSDPPVGVGFDSCSVPMVLSNTKVPPILMETCESTRFSLYIDAYGNVLPCSFSKGKWEEFNIFECEDFYKDVWMNPLIVKFRERQLAMVERCSECPHWGDCLGGCRVFPEIVKCKRFNEG